MLLNFNISPWQSDDPKYISKVVVTGERQIKIKTHDGDAVENILYDFSELLYKNIWYFAPETVYFLFDGLPVGGAILFDPIQGQPNFDAVIFPSSPKFRIIKQNEEHLGIAIRGMKDSRNYRKVVVDDSSNLPTVSYTHLTLPTKA